MAVIIDDEEFNAAKLGLGTLGQILLHLQRNNRLVLRLLIDGEAPDPAHIESVRSTGASDHIIYLETVDARQTALDSIALAQQRVGLTDLLAYETADCGQWWGGAIDAIGALIPATLPVQSAA